MGMFDLVLCNHELFGAHKGEEHQTKDLEGGLGGLLDDYEITPEGRLVFLEYRIEDRGNPKAAGIERLGGSMTRVFTGGRLDMNYEGWLHLSAFGRAKFVDGTIVAFEPEPYSDRDEAPVDPAKQAARRIMRSNARRKLAASQPFVRDRREHMTVRDLREQLNELDQDSEVSLFLGDPQAAGPRSVSFVDQHGKGIEVELTVEPAESVDLVQSHAEFVKSGIEIRDVFGLLAEDVEPKNAAEDDEK